jgi:hypothetical protein
MKSCEHAFLWPKEVIFDKTLKMKALLSWAALTLFMVAACKTEKKTEPEATAEPPTILEKVAMAHGYEHWKEVAEIRFTFNVDRDTAHFERSWIWSPATGEVTGITAQDTAQYNRKAVDSTMAKWDASFVNDKFWFLAPFQLVWDKDSFTYEYTEEATSPVAKTPMQKLTIVYGNEGGYTPGDAYDLYLDEGNMVREWTFRRGNKPAPGSDASWEGYVDMDGMQLATMHELGGNAKLYFSGVSVTHK